MLVRRGIDCVNLVGVHQDGQNGTHLSDVSCLKPAGNYVQPVDPDHVVVSRVAAVQLRKNLAAQLIQMSWFRSYSCPKPYGEAGSSQGSRPLA